MLADELKTSFIRSTNNPFIELKGGPIEVPMDSVYMTAIVSPLAANGRKYSCQEGFNHCFVAWWFVLWHYFILVVNGVIQLTFIYYAWDVVQDEAGEYNFCHDDQYLLIICFLLFASGIIKDARETMAMWLWLYQFPPASGWEELELTLEDEDPEKAKEGEERKKKINSGMPIWYKLLVSIFVVLPKYGISVLLFLAGGTYLVRSRDREDLIINSVALFFILDIDEMLWKNLIPPEHQVITTEEIPPIRSPLSNAWLLELFTLVNGVATLLVSAAMTGGLYYLACGIEPDVYNNSTVSVPAE